MPKCGNEHLESLTWAGGPTELCWSDCGKTFEVNAVWVAALSTSFMPDQTLAIMHADGDPTYIRALTDGQPRLQLVHALLAGATAMFLYR